MRESRMIRSAQQYGGINGDLLDAAQQILCCQFNVSQDRTQQARTSDFASVDRNSGRSSIWMAEKKVAPAPFWRGR